MSDTIRPMIAASSGDAQALEHIAGRLADTIERLERELAERSESVRLLSERNAEIVRELAAAREDKERLGAYLRAQLAWDCAEGMPWEETGRIRTTLCNLAQWRRDLALGIDSEFKPQPLGIDVFSSEITSYSLEEAETIATEMLDAARRAEPAS